MSVELAWSSMLTEDAFEQVSVTDKKVKSKECLTEGLYPVIDQGRNLIGGYINDPTKIIKVDSPVVVFGDHTRIIKWINFDFVPGADGTKVLIPRYFLDERFFYYQLRSIQIEDRGYGRHFKLLQESSFKVAPLAEQQQIATLLDQHIAQVEQIKARLDAIPALLKKFRQSVLADAVSGRLTEGWRGEVELKGWINGHLADFIEKPDYGTSSKSAKEGLIPVLRMGNLQSGEIDWTDLVYTSDALEIKKYNLRKGDLLFNRTNSPDLVGKTSIYRGERKAIFAGYLIRIRPTLLVLSDFINYHLNSHLAKDYCYRVKSDGVSQSNINAKKLLAYPLHCPPLEEQIEIVRRVEQLFAFADQIERRVLDAQKRVNNLTQAILAKAFSGELTAEWRKQNPELISGEKSAAALLQRIKAEEIKPVKRGRNEKTWKIGEK